MAKTDLDVAVLGAKLDAARLLTMPTAILRWPALQSLRAELVAWNPPVGEAA
ncbi:MAG: hypothetical protein ACR2HE_03615 [Casimicrobiaceae bacterium]